MALSIRSATLACVTALATLGASLPAHALDAEQKSFVPRKRTRKMREAYKMLPKEFTTEILVEHGVAKDLKRASNTVLRWEVDGLVKRIEAGKYIKNFKEIPE